MRSPINYFGGKGKLVKQLLPLIPPHRQYVEPFFGGGSVYFAKKPCGHETINDLNGDVINFYRVLQSPEGLVELQRLLDFTPYARQVYDDARVEWETATDPLRRAYLFFVIARMSMSGMFGVSWGYTVTESNRNRPSSLNNFRMATERLGKVHERLRDTQIECKDALDLIKHHDDPECFMYLDPPYMKDTRRGGGYECEMNDDQHKALLELIVNCKSKILLSGYGHPLYEEALKSWNRKEFHTACSAAVRSKSSGLQGEGKAKEKQPRIEVVWYNYNIGQS